MKTQKAYFAAGCFWGVQYYFSKLSGVIKTTVGFMGGEIANPSYAQVKTGKTGHLEVIEVLFDSEIISYEELVKYFFEIHNFEQIDGQGPDLGSQYLSVIFYDNADQKETAFKIFGLLIGKGYKVATQLREASTFFVAEDYHQDYYQKKGETPYCHVHKKIF